MTRDYKAEVLQFLTNAGSWVKVEVVHDAMRNASAIYRPWGHVSKALVELEREGLVEYQQRHDGEVWRIKS
jgi:hypothetical protein